MAVDKRKCQSGVVLFVCGSGILQSAWPARVRRMRLPLGGRITAALSSSGRLRTAATDTPPPHHTTDLSDAANATENHKTALYPELINKPDLLAVVHDFLLCANLYRCKFLNLFVVIAKTFGDLFVERRDEIFEGTRETLAKIIH